MTSVKMLPLSLFDQQQFDMTRDIDADFEMGGRE